jgi:hypothetical protein
MPLLVIPLISLAVGGGTGFFLGLESSKLLKFAAVAAAVYFLYRSGALK